MPHGSVAHALLGLPLELCKEQLDIDCFRLLLEYQAEVVTTHRVAVSTFHTGCGTKPKSSLSANMLKCLSFLEHLEEGRIGEHMGVGLVS